MQCRPLRGMGVWYEALNLGLKWDELTAEVPDLIVLQGDPYGRGTVFVD